MDTHIGQVPAHTARQDFERHAGAEEMAHGSNHALNVHKIPRVPPITIIYLLYHYYIPVIYCVPLCLFEANLFTTLFMLTQYSLDAQVIPEPRQLNNIQQYPKQSAHLIPPPHLSAGSFVTRCRSALEVRPVAMPRFRSCVCNEAIHSSCCSALLCLAI